MPRACVLSPCLIVVAFDDNKRKMARKPGKKLKKNPVGCTGEGKRRKCNIGEGSKEGKTGIVLKFGLEVR